MLSLIVTRLSFAIHFIHASIHALCICLCVCSPCTVLVFYEAFTPYLSQGSTMHRPAKLSVWGYPKGPPLVQRGCRPRYAISPSQTFAKHPNPALQIHTFLTALLRLRPKVSPMPLLVLPFFLTGTPSSSRLLMVFMSMSVRWARRCHCCCLASSIFSGWVIT